MQGKADRGAAPQVNDPLDQAFAAYLRACDEGRLASREEFLQQYPELADQLSDLMQMADSLGEFVASSSDESSSDSAVPRGRAPNPQSPPRSQPGTGQDRESDVDTIAPGGRSLFSSAAADVNAETLHWVTPSDKTDVLTLPVPQRKAGECGPTLPYELGDYRLLQILGRGGMGVVYLAEQKGLERRVAVKMIRSGILASEAEVRRFAMEAKAAAALEHRNIVSVYQSGYLDGHYYFSMEYVPGVDLSKLIEQAPLDPRQAARYVRDVARAIDHAHRRGVLHRDLKPANVLITPDDEVRVTDFGLAKQIDTDSSVTGSGAAVGTPNYMAPEQASGHSDRVRVQSDVYSLGALLFAAIAGRAPFGGESVMQTLLQVIHYPAPPLRALAPHAPEDLETIVAKCLEKAPEDRYPTAAHLAEELDAYLDERPITARPRPLLTRLRHWLQQVPLIAALLGRRVIEPSEQHRRFQAAMLGLLIVIPLFLLTVVGVQHYVSQRMPAVVLIAGGLEGGVYDDFSRALGDRLTQTSGVETRVLSSSGSLDNRERLLGSKIHLAPMQAGAMGNDDLCVVAPLFFEAVHVLVRKDSPFTSVGEIAGHPVAVGPAGSGSRLATEMVLQSLGLPPETTPRRVISWPELRAIPIGHDEDDRVGSVGGTQIPQIAIICIGRRSKLVESLLSGAADEAGTSTQGGHWRLLPIASAIRIALEHPILQPMTIEANDYPGADLPPDGIGTVGTTAFLVARWRVPDSLVTAALEALYEPPLNVPGLIPRDPAREWQGHGFHPAARRYFDRR
jgi:eukaryotic-like serine/threonine-protein kinase